MDLYKATTSSDYSTSIFAMVMFPLLNQIIGAFFLGVAGVMEDIPKAWPPLFCFFRLGSGVFMALMCFEYAGQGALFLFACFGLLATSQSEEVGRSFWDSSLRPNRLKT